MVETDRLPKRQFWMNGLRLLAVGVVVTFMGCFATGGSPDYPEVMANEDVYLLQLTPL